MCNNLVVEFNSPEELAVLLPEFFLTATSSSQSFLPHCLIFQMTQVLSTLLASNHGLSCGCCIHRLQEHGSALWQMLLYLMIVIALSNVVDFCQLLLHDKGSVYCHRVVLVDIFTSVSSRGVVS
jgi:hypothetical protein